MGIANSPDILQQKMNAFTIHLNLSVHIYELFVLTKIDCTYHVQKLVFSLFILKLSQLLENRFCHQPQQPSEPKHVTTIQHTIIPTTT